MFSVVRYDLQLIGKAAHIGAASSHRQSIMHGLLYHQFGTTMVEFVHCTHIILWSSSYIVYLVTQYTVVHTMLYAVRGVVRVPKLVRIYYMSMNYTICMHGEKKNEFFSDLMG